MSPAGIGDDVMHHATKRYGPYLFEFICLEVGIRSGIGDGGNSMVSWLEPVSRQGRPRRWCQTQTLDLGVLRTLHNVEQLQDQLGVW
jgi:hypothetical protein